MGGQVNSKLKGISNETMGSASYEVRNCSGVLGSSYFVGVSGYVECGRICGGDDGKSFHEDGLQGASRI